MNTQGNIPSNIPSKDPAWSVYVQDGHLFVSAGADRVYLVDELNADEVARFHSGYQQDAWPALQQQPAFRAVIEKLVILGALYYAGPQRDTLRAALRWAGEPLPALVEWLDLLVSRRRGIEWVDVESAHVDLVLVVRTNATLQNTSAQSSEETRPHLLLDLAYHATLAVGPFVVPGQTACLGCLTGRLMHLWGDMPPPAQPAMNVHIELAGAVIMAHLETFRTRGTINALVGNTWTLDTETWASRFHPVFRLPWCPVCAQGRKESETGLLQGVF